MHHELTGRSDREDRRNQVLLTYLEALQSGREPDRDQFLAAYPDQRQNLESFLAGHDEVKRLTAPFRAISPDGLDGTGVLPRDGSTGLPRGLGELGDFRLLREVGRGGMGIVYEAEQISLRRRVALKVVPFAAALDPRHFSASRPRRSPRRTYSMRRIVAVHAVGCERGVHYYAMQFIDGQSLAALIKELRRLRDDQDRHAPSTRSLR